MLTESHGEALDGGDLAATAANELVAHKRMTFNAQLGVLICPQCRTGIRPGKGVIGHFRKVHQTTGRALRDIVGLRLALEPLADPG